MNLHKDCKGNEIRTGAIVERGKRKGIVLNDEMEGQYVEFRNGIKLRIKDSAKQLKVISPGISRKIEKGVFIDGARRY